MNREKIVRRWIKYSLKRRLKVDQLASKGWEETRHRPSDIEELTMEYVGHDVSHKVFR